MRAAVVGVGYLGRFHAEKYKAHAAAELVGVVDTDGDRARSVARDLGVRAFTDHRELLGKVDCASVAVPTHAHHAVAHDLIVGGIDVLVEKPLTTTIEDGKALLEVAVRGGRVLQVGHLERFNPAIRALGDRVTQPRFIECQRLAPFTERGTDVDVVLDLMIHDLDIILNMVKSPLRSVEAVGVPVLTPSVDIANARLRFANGCIANITASRVSLKRERKLRIFQADAYFSIDFDERRVRICRRESDADGQPSLTIEGSGGPRRRRSPRGDRCVPRRGPEARDACRDRLGWIARARGGARDPGERRDGGARASRSAGMMASGEASRVPSPTPARRVLLVAGEASGDLHGADFLRSLRATLALGRGLRPGRRALPRRGHAHGGRCGRGRRPWGSWKAPRGSGRSCASIASCAAVCARTRRISAC